MVFFSRKSAVLDMLGRHVQLSEDEEYLNKENFVSEKLSIPSQWIYEAKATLASTCNRYVNKCIIVSIAQNLTFHSSNANVNMKPFHH